VKGYCDWVSSDLVQHLGPDWLILESTGLLSLESDAAEEVIQNWSHKKQHISHCVAYNPKLELVIDLTGLQFGRRHHRPIQTLREYIREWVSFTLMSPFPGKMSELRKEI
jgi:hypothetical protein